MNDRGNAWLKIKPDYVHSNDIDAVIIGAFYGTGRHGGLVTQWLLALAEAPPGGSRDTPSNFMSFCKYAILHPAATAFNSSHSINRASCKALEAPESWKRWGAV